MELKDIQNAGSDILDAVSDAVSRGDYSNLSETIRRSVNTISEAGMKSAGQAAKNMRRDAYVFSEHMKGSTAAWQRPESLRTYSKGNKKITVSASPGTAVSNALPATPYFTQGQRFSPYAGGVQAALGIVGCLGTGAVAIPTLLTGLIAGVVPATVVGAVFAAGLAASAFVTKKGFDKQRLFTRYRKYGRVIGDAEYIRIDDLSHLSGVDKKRLIQDIRTCQDKGYLSESFIDTQETTLMVTRSSYDQYVKAEQGRLQREKEERRLQENLSGSVYGAEVTRIISEGEDYLKTVKELNDRIPDEEMSRKISRIEELMHRTFEEVKRQPKSANSLRKYMSYYLPTTVKLLNAYADLDGKPEIGENIAQTKREISDSLDMVGDAFEKLFDSLFEEMSWDISSDISVMKTMMAQDGLTEDSVVFQKQE